jgi:hypothetical protein
MQTDKRIRSESAAFGALNSILTNKDIDLKVKESVDVAFCLSILLYGSEIRCLRKDLFKSPLSLASPMRSYHVPHYHRSHNSPPYLDAHMKRRKKEKKT